MEIDRRCTMLEDNRGLTCYHCGTADPDVRMWSERVREGVYVSRPQCTNLVECWGRWDEANMGEQSYNTAKVQVVSHA
jgi:hypothetical protein